MDNNNLLDDLKKLVKKHSLSEPSLTYNDFLHELKFTEAGKRLAEKMFADGKPMNCIPDCTVKLHVSDGVAEITVHHEDTEIGYFKKIGTKNLDTTYNFCGVPIQLKMGPW